ncbi:uncharacterized protein LOC125881539 isoform X3 [Epinephelus fuscoguttatus]|uniref:uncharacterized protein LOC125881539 isoform X3 n=1 Tax=Epinephelus fuscoguttatus TaxID=293821 RepID=UPI0020D0F6ED|nr:uncharacterized protein LOC125881539 isoform X3 [Epinephelus fuscoguttatus]
MESRSRVQNRIPFFLLILGNVATALSGLNLDCTNDYVDLMFCHFDAQNCEGYNLTLRSHYDNGTRHCIPAQCGMGQCCCTFHGMILVSGETHSATVWKGGKSMESKIISIRDSIKPRKPTITSVKESNGNFQILWKTNHEGYFSEHLTAEVTYHIKGGTVTVTKPVKPTTFKGQNYYEIPGEDLESSTTYAVSVRSYTNRSGKFSDSSEEREFTTRLNLDCTNDYVELMFCHFDAQNCEGYNLTLRSHYDNGTRHCIPAQCDMGQCCCTFHGMTLVSGETHSATVWKEGKIMESKIISIRDSIKPRKPTITSVKESNGNFQILWKTNHEGLFSQELTTEVTYRKKGDTVKVTKPVKQTLDYYYEIPGEDLEPSTTYAVSVRSYTNRSGKFSDSSEEWEFTTRLNLDCTNDNVDLMFCHFDAQNCEGYNLTLRSHYDNGTRHCIPAQCDMGQCCCTFHGMRPVSGETHSATVWKGGKSMESKIISIRDSIKPRKPTITSVKESNGNFQILWKTNHEGLFSEHLTAEVTYRKKGDTVKVTKPVKQTLDYYYEIPGEDLEPSTTYAVSVRSYTNRSGKFSDSSEEWEFTTPMAAYILPLVIIISLSVAAVIISIAAYCCYVKLKTKWWETVSKCPNPKLLITHPSEQELLKPVRPTISSICVEPFVPDDSKPWSKESLRDTSSGSPQQSSGISTGSSCLSCSHTKPADIIAGVQDALVKAFPNISPISPLTTVSLNPEVNKDSGLLSLSYDPCGVRADDVSSGSSCFDNKTYFIPSCSQEMTTNCSEVQTQADMLCDSTYHPRAGDEVTCVDQQASACSFVKSQPVVSFPIPTEMPYEQRNADFGSFSEASSLSSTSSGASPMSFNEMDCGTTKPHGKTEGEIVCDENTCLQVAKSVPADALSFPLVDDNYQSFQNLVEQPDILFSEERSGEKEPQLNKCPEETFTKMTPGFMNNVQSDQCPSELQRPFLPLISAEQSMPIITDSGYQSV